MSMRIQPDVLTGSGAVETKRLDQVSELPTRPRAESRSNSPQHDQVEISPLSAAISSARELDGRHRAERVRALGALYNSGQDKIDSAQLANSIVSDALANGLGGLAQ